MKKDAFKIVLLMLTATAMTIIAMRIIVEYEMKKSIENIQMECTDDPRFVARDKWGGQHAMLPCPTIKDSLPPHLYGRKLLYK